MRTVYSNYISQVLLIDLASSITLMMRSIGSTISKSTIAAW